ncbi:MAG: hypothetical protein ACK506_05410 [Pirellula sp.]
MDLSLDRSSAWPKIILIAVKSTPQSTRSLASPGIEYWVVHAFVFADVDITACKNGEYITHGLPRFTCPNSNVKPPL